MRPMQLTEAEFASLSTREQVTILRAALIYKTQFELGRMQAEVEQLERDLAELEALVV